MTQKIVSGYDGSPRARAATRWAAAEATRRGAELTLLRVWPRLGPADPEGPGADPVQQAEHDDLEALAADLLAAHPDLAVATQAAAGDPADLLVEAAADYDLAVLGSYGQGAVADLLGSSVALSVAARAACPVVLVREEPADQDARLVEEDAPLTAEAAAQAPVPVPAGLPIESPLDPPVRDDARLATAPAAAGSPLTAAVRPPAAEPGSTPGIPAGPEIVVGLAGDSSLPAVEFALAEAARSGGRVRAVHGWEMVPLWAATPGWLPTDPDADHQAERIEADLDRLLAPARAAHPGVELRVEAGLGGATGALLAAAEHADLLVIGRHPHLFGNRLGPVVHAAVRHSTAPVVLVPHD
ncbi:universal stress protein [Kitasatospora phosalacinea]|uniref:universal stress protein n=1 Tax=Kitasatospora phosalacinea TaxID=2065 RepID=UPI00055DF16A|nr:universal stress protein [Kitasatospora phosalacinea]